MGCCSSSESIPQGPPPRAEPPRREHLVWFNSSDMKGIEVSRIEDSLHSAADHLKQKGSQITVVAAGGIVDALRLRHDHPVHDLFFFNFHLTQAEKDTLKSAMEIGEKAYNAPVAQACFHQAAVSEMGREVEKELTDNSLFCNQTLFEAGGLRVIACEDMYSFITKATRLDTPNQRHYDLSDAVGYVRCMMQSSRSTSPIPMRAIVQYSQKYRKVVPTGQQLQRIDAEHRARYRYNAIAG